MVDYEVETDRIPFQPDPTRGNWAKPRDFILSACGLAFRLDFMFLYWSDYAQMGIGSCIPYVICLILYVVPIMFLQSFMGQFSSSGFISALRLSPLHKCIGYMGAVFNMVTLTYYSVFVATPLLFLVHSLQPTVPWDCAEHNYATFTEFYDQTNKSICHLPYVEPNKNLNQSNITDYIATYQMPAEMFIGSLFNITSLDKYYTTDSNPISWQLAGFILLSWGIIALILHFYFNTEKFGKFLRYAILVTFIVLVICIIRFAFLSGAKEGVRQFFSFKRPTKSWEIFGIFIQVMYALGSGWGTLITLSSFNRFKTDTMRYTWAIALGQMFIFLLFTLMTSILDGHVTDILNRMVEDYFVSNLGGAWKLIIHCAQAISIFGWPNMWYILTFGMLTAAGLIVQLIQIHSLLTSVFDEHEILRAHKIKVIHGLIASLALCSLYFSTQDGFINFMALTMDSKTVQIALNLLLLVFVFGFFEVPRFKRDIAFMLGRPFPKWQLFLCVFIAPYCLALLLVESLTLSVYEHKINVLVIQFVAFIFFALIWLFIPVYYYYSLRQVTGTFCQRLRRCCRPLDWFPLDMDERLRYEAAMIEIDEAKRRKRAQWLVESKNLRIELESKEL